MTCLPLSAQQVANQQSDAVLQARVEALEREVTELKTLVKQLHATQSESSSQFTKPSGSTANDPATPQSADLSAQDRSTLDFLRDTSVNLYLDTYYDYNFNQPVGRVNLLRAYDVLSNEFSLNQAAVIFDHPPDVSAGRRWGGRLDLQFGQATDTLQGNPANEPRPEIYRNIFLAYGSYVLPIGKGMNVDFGKWSSSLGIEGNYTKDQMNYSRAFWYDFLPFYHVGLRISIPVSDGFSINYWVVNGTNQVEAPTVSRMSFLALLQNRRSRFRGHSTTTWGKSIQIAPRAQTVAQYQGSRVFVSQRLIPPLTVELTFSIATPRGRQPRSWRSLWKVIITFSGCGEIPRRANPQHRRT